MLLYHIPDLIWNQATSLDCFRPLAEAMVDYALFHARVWKEVCVDGTLDAFLSTAQYQLALHVRSDTDIDDAGAYPSFELEWRRLLATRLKNILPTPPAALCPSIHRVIRISSVCTRWGRNEKTLYLFCELSNRIFGFTAFCRALPRVFLNACENKTIPGNKSVRKES
jgi:hypothetical protein